jgi:cysteine desulfurase
MCAAGEGAYGNPSSAHWAGAPAKQALESGRQQVASILGCSAEEVVLTSGGSEANNLALKGVFFANQSRGAHIVTTQVEHPSILAPCAFLERQGAKITYLPVDHTARLDPEDLRRAITPATTLISIMHANNEVGTVQPIAACARIAREHGIPIHTDAAQSVGKISSRVGALGVDLLSIAGHKVYAPKGVGALYIRGGTRMEPLIHGAGHERGRRAGTENALLATALGVACEIGSDLSAMGRIREVLAAAEGIAASTGSACHSGRVELSPVLRAMGISQEVGVGAVRFSLGRSTTADEIVEVAERVSSVLM